MVGNLLIYESAVFYNKQECWLCHFVRNRSTSQDQEITRKFFATKAAIDFTV